MDYLKSLWAKIVAFLCCTQNPETPKEKMINQTQESKTEQKNESLAHEDAKKMFNGALSTKQQGALFLAIEKTNSHDEIVNAIQNGADVNKSINGLDPLEYAIKNKNSTAINILTQSGAIIKNRHLELARGYITIFLANLQEEDMNIPGVQDIRPIKYEEIRQYNMILNLLGQISSKQQTTASSQATASNTELYHVAKSITEQPKAGGGATASINQNNSATNDTQNCTTTTEKESSQEYVQILVQPSDNKDQ